MNKYFSGFLTKVLIAFLSISFFFSCGPKKVAEIEKDVLVSLNGETLYLQDVLKLIPRNCISEDSAAFVNDYIYSWVSERLMYADAKNKLTDTAIIVQKINEYRRQLYIHYYKENLIYSEVNTEVSLEEINEYYNKHLSDYVLETSYVKAHYLTMDAKVIQHSDEWEKIHNNGLEDEKFLKDYCIGTGRKVYFIKDWTEIRNFLDIINYTDEFSEYDLGNKNDLIYINGDLRYIVKIDEYRKKGDYMPLEIITPQITQIIINNRKEKKIVQVKNDLIENAKKEGKLIIK
jgi:hypothetical protein